MVSYRRKREEPLLKAARLGLVCRPLLTIVRKSSQNPL
jgi:hypothetical protein